jgi:alkanesulfonate monooxygenase SsuD/methylene tetrahydromethanopterin reductase-like flavin-dependent oxidoreductase (luciferase family)
LDIKFGFQQGANAGLLGIKTDDYRKVFAYCEKEGYDSLFVWDHLNASPATAIVPSCSVMLACAALETKKVKIGSCVTEPHRRHPAQIALDSLTLQTISEGRHILGIGAGESMNLDNFGIKWDKPATRLIESVEIIKGLWGTATSDKESFNYSGQFFNLKNASLQYPVENLPKLWIAANGPRLIEFAGKDADGWLPLKHNPRLYERNLKILGKSRRLDEIEKACEVYVVISKDKPDIAKKIGHMMGLDFCVNPYILDEYNIKLPEGLKWQTHSESLSEIIEERNERRKFAQENVPNEVADSMCIFGSPEDCIEQIENYIKAGVEHFLIEIFGVGTYFETLELFTDTVVKYFKESK